LGTFSLSPEELERVLHESERAAVESLRASGFEVIEPADFRAHLKEAGVANTFDDGILLRYDLSSYFEPARTANGPSLEVATLTSLEGKGVLQADALLFGEVVYHTRTTCSADPSRYNSHAVVAQKSADVSPGPTPCIVSHFQAKLVYAPTGETMWFNRMLLQTYVDQPEQQAARSNMIQAVARTLAGPHGLKEFDRGKPAVALERSASTE
jgi:hypothetical protein